MGPPALHAFPTRRSSGLQLGLRLPLPVEPGYRWAWVAPGATPLALPPTAQPETPVYGHGPQTLAEGWLLLEPDPAAARRSAEHTSGLQSQFHVVCRLLAG